MKRTASAALIFLGLGAGDCFAMPTDARARYEEEDKRLGELYRTLIARLRKCRPELVAPLRASERKWIDFRDAECAFQERAEPTDLYKVKCLEHLTLQRIETLKKTIEAVEGAECEPAPGKGKEAP